MWFSYGTQRHSTFVLHSSHILFFVWKQGLTRLMRVSQLAEAVLEPAILLSQPPKYWDYKRAPPHPALILFFILKQGFTKLMRVSLLAQAGLEPVILLSQLPKY